MHSRVARRDRLRPRPCLDCDEGPAPPPNENAEQTHPTHRARLPEQIPATWADEVSGVPRALWQTGPGHVHERRKRQVRPEQDVGPHLRHYALLVRMEN